LQLDSASSLAVLSRQLGPRPSARGQRFDPRSKRTLTAR